MHMSNHIFLIITKLYLIVSYLIIVFQNANWNLKNILADNQWKSLLLIKWANPDYFFIPRTNALLYKKTRFWNFYKQYQTTKMRNAASTVVVLLLISVCFESSCQAPPPHVLKIIHGKSFSVKTFNNYKISIWIVYAIALIQNQFWNSSETKYN